MTIHDIDFAHLYREHLAAAGFQPKSPEAWDARVAEMRERQEESAYVRAFVERVDLEGATTLLDVGCGTGAIALALAPRLQRVHGLDHSAGMLQALVEQATVRGFTNVHPLHRAWEDDWSDVPECDIVVASRSTLVRDLADALRKVDAKARRRAYMTSLVGGRFLCPEVLAVLGRDLFPLPDYIYIVNLLYQMGHHPRLDYLEGTNRLAGTRDFDSFAARVASSVGPLSPDERHRLRQWYEADPERAFRGGGPCRWALISWEKPSSPGVEPAVSHPPTGPRGPSPGAR